MGKYLDQYCDSPNRPPGPRAGTWSLKYLDRLTGIRLRFNKSIKELYSDFPDVLSPGTELPEIHLRTTAGERINTRDYLGKKILVLMTGAIT